MDSAAALQRSYAIVRETGAEPDIVTGENFIAHTARTIDIIRGWAKTKRESEPWLKEYLLAIKKLSDDFSRIVRADPMIAYKPKNKVAEAFHRSSAFVRYFRAGNRSSKTTAGYLENAWFVTGRHPYRYIPPGVNNVVILAGLPFTQYSGKVFGKKMLYGEEDNVLSPLFPYGGKWFSHYDEKKYTLRIACKACAELGQALSCPKSHPWSEISLLSSENDAKSVEAFVARLVHIDEHVDEAFYHALKMRLASARHSSMIITGTPLHGMEAWEKRLLADTFEGPPELNYADPADPDSGKRIDMFQISMWDAGVVDHAVIRRDMQDMDEFEVRARIDGFPAPLAKNPVFDRQALALIRQQVSTPVRGSLSLLDTVTLEDAAYSREVAFTPVNQGMLRLWEKPEPGGHYLLAADVAAGLAARKGSKRGDASCCTVLRLLPQPTGRTKLKVVAQFHGWLTTDDYADEIKRLGVWYNYAMVVIELTGIGRGVMHRLRKQLFYSNLFLDTTAPETLEVDVAGRLGVDTNAYSKPQMIGALQQAIKYQLIEVPCADTVEELAAYEQEKSEAGINYRYRGAGGSPDDRVMSLAIGTYVCFTFPVIDFALDDNKLPDNKSPELREVEAELRDSWDENPYA